MTLHASRLAVFIGLLLCVCLVGGVTTATAQQPGIPGVERDDPTGGAVPGDTLGTRSRTDVWRGVRSGLQGTVSIPDKKAGLLVQAQGNDWRAFLEGPLPRWGAVWLGAIPVLLLLFYLIRGRMRVDAGFSGRTIIRFTFLDRMAHWFLAGSFIVLALTGLNITYGKLALLPLIGRPAFATLTAWGKYAHDFTGFAFIAALVLLFVIWFVDNLPNRHDVTWLLQGGGMFTRGTHPPAGKFNAGQKILFWMVVAGGLSLALSGVDLLFPFEIALFSKTFAAANLLGANLPVDLAPVHEMQLAVLWHAMMALFLIGAIIMHVYIGTLGMEGAFQSMTSGEVDVNWARQHHSAWAKEVLGPEPASIHGEPAPAQ